MPPAPRHRHAAGTLTALVWIGLVWPGLPAWAEPPAGAVFVPSSEPEEAPATDPSPTGATRHADFLAAEAALKAGKFDRYRDLTVGLADHPLLPYLRYQELTRTPDTLTQAGVEAFLAAYPDSHLAERLRGAWLKRLVAARRWAEVVQLHRPNGSAERECNFRHALLATGHRDQALGGIEPLWLGAGPAEGACDPVFAAWTEAGGLTPALTWAAIEAALTANRPKQAKELGRYLPPADRTYLDLWLDLHNDPAKAADPATFATAHPQRGPLIGMALGRLAARSPTAAAAAWGRLSTSLPETAAVATRIDAAIGLALAEAGDRGGLDYLDRVPANADNQDFQGRRLRAALKLGAWDRVAAWVGLMPAGEDKTDLWRYWQARAEEALGHREAAEALYRQAAEARSLWGFLAAERLGLPYRLDPRPTPADPERMARLQASPTLARIRALRELGRTPDMRREWASLTADLGPHDLQAAALVAQGLDWPDQAIRTLATSGYWDDLALRFPLAYRAEVRAEATANALPEAWVYAVVREESSFDPGAGSPAGAIGLMQLMPDTARDVARSSGRCPPTRGDILSPGTNIALGSTYLAALARRYDGHPAAVTAAYNAGPKRVDAWLPAEPMPADLWIATIPFRETRDYVRRVLAYRLIYADRLGTCPTPLSVNLEPMVAPAVQAGP